MTATLTERLPKEVVDAATARLSRLRAEMQSAEIDALLIGFPIEIRYLTGFIGDDSLLLVDGDSAWIVTDPRHDEYLEPWRSVGGIEVEMGVRHRLEPSVAARCRTRGIRRLGIQADRMTVAARGRVADAVGAEHVVDTTGLVSGLRMKKDDLEIAAIEGAVAIQEAALDATLADLRIGMTEIEFCARLEYEMKSRGATGPSFGLIIGAGANSSIIHHSTGAAPIERGMLLVDWGAIAGGYCSDMTRTFGVGGLPEPMRDVYELVLEAQLAAIEACAPGRTCAEIDAVARSIIDKAGHGEHFGHGLGHGLGMEIHEDPYFNDLETETRLEPGMVMTVEPGIYLPGVGGVRIEDDILITERGGRVLSHRAKDAASAAIEPA